jgi:hypothetical protein
MVFAKLPLAVVLLGVAPISIAWAGFKQVAPR